tara:strand:+ start:70690 stop:70968 length:279 start_codon:yes stop_codon:yes gene_type:complete
MTIEVYDIRYERLRKSIDVFTRNWIDGTLKELGTKLPELVVGEKRYAISEVMEKSDGIYVRFFNGLYTRWKRLASTDEIVFNDINHKLIWST